jgi:3-carboxy-cis,cis-muconate cycloisomerase
LTSNLIRCLGTTEEMAAVFSDDAVLGAMLEFEVALARAQARLDIIPPDAADIIASAPAPDAARIAREARQSATPAIPLVKALRAHSEFAHFGATSQDVIDTSLVLLLKRAAGILARDSARLDQSLRELSDRHAGTVMLGRTLLQPALPITFGYKAAGWYASVRRSWRRLSGRFDEALRLQFGGAAGTLASYGGQALVLAAELAKELNLPAPGPPWHTQRDRLAAIVGASGIYAGVLGKIARDVSLLMQHEVGEVAEAGGGSSAMPDKRNPSGCVVALAAATRMPGLVAQFLTGMTQEHERAAGGWQAEWQTMADVVQTTHSALAAVAGVIDELTVFPDRMRSNLDQAQPDTGAAEHFRRQLLEE